MPVIAELTDLQRGTLWGEYAEAVLIGIYSCLFVVTLWGPVGSKQPLHLVGWTVIAIYCLTLCRVVVCFWILYRSLFVNGGDVLRLESTDYVLRGLQEGFSFMAVLASDGLFCWRLYVIWSRNIRIILLPACLLVVNVTGFTAIVVTDFLSAARPNDLRYITLNLSLFIWVLAVSLAYTVYITVFIAGRLWWVGNATNNSLTLTPEEEKRNRYQGAINALVQSGVIYSVTMVVSIISVALLNTVMITVLGCIAAPLNGISATLLVLQLNMYQDQTKRDEDSKRPLSTGASIQFATPQGAASSIDAERTQSPAMRRRRASIATCQYGECCKDVVDVPGKPPATFISALPKAPYLPIGPSLEGKSPRLGHRTES